jgi:hypothetical protein
MRKAEWRKAVFEIEDKVAAATEREREAMSFNILRKLSAVFFNSFFLIQNSADRERDVATVCDRGVGPFPKNDFCGAPKPNASAPRNRLLREIFPKKNSDLFASFHLTP